MKTHNSLFFKIALVAVIALLMLVPLTMVKSLVRERQNYADGCRAEVSQSWGNAQTLSGPAIEFSYDQEETDADGKKVVRHLKKTVYPKDLRYDVAAATQKLHRSIYDVMVYRADVTARGSFVLPKEIADLALQGTVVTLGISDLRGIEGNVELTLDGQDYIFSEGSAGDRSEKTRIWEALSLDRQRMDGATALPFSLRFKLKGSETLSVRPYGELTEVHIHSDCPDPSFTGDFLPSERDVREDGFDAQWVVSQINRGKPDDTSFGVRMLQPVTQYRQSERSAKYGILIILLVFVAGLAVELVGKKEISLVQYVVIGLSLVLFYALVLAFSEFIAFPAAYALAAAMTTAALLGYFRGILRDRKAWLLGALVALAYAVSYFLLQMETYAFLTGTLILFALLSAIMYLTRGLTRQGTPEQDSEACDNLRERRLETRD